MVFVSEEDAAEDAGGGMQQEKQKPTRQCGEQGMSREQVGCHSLLDIKDSVALSGNPWKI